MREICEAGQAGNAIGQQDGMRTSIEYLGDALEGLLSRCVPDLELEHRLMITVTHLEKKGAKLHADSDFVILHELIGGDSVHQAGLAYT